MFFLLYSDVPRGTIQDMKNYLTIIIFLIVTSCSKPDPHPELKDPIYSDLQSILDTTTKTLETEKKKLEDTQKELESVTPQTGEIKHVQHKMTESQSLINRLEQEKQYLQIKIEQRRIDDVLSYNKSFKLNKPWPNPAEYEAYRIQQKLRNAKKTWDVKDRMKQAGISPSGANKNKSSGAEHHNE